MSKESYGGNMRIKQNIKNVSNIKVQQGKTLMKSEQKTFGIQTQKSITTLQTSQQYNPLLRKSERALLSTKCLQQIKFDKRAVQEYGSISYQNDIPR